MIIITFNLVTFQYPVPEDPDVISKVCHLQQFILIFPNPQYVHLSDQSANSYHQQIFIQVESPNVSKGSKVLISKYYLPFSHNFNQFY